MDALKAEIALKRKNLSETSAVGGRPTKYMRRGDIERLKEEQDRRAREEMAAEEAKDSELEKLTKHMKEKVSIIFAWR